MGLLQWAHHVEEEEEEEEGEEGQVCLALVIRTNEGSYGSFYSRSAKFHTKFWRLDMS